MTSPSPSNTPLAPKPEPDSRLFQPLNPEQQEAVRTLEGPLLIIAGAGTGKTRVIAHRLVHLLESKPDLAPANLLALTFSKRAAQEMLERVEGLRGAFADELGVFTFHGFCHRFIQDHALELGLPVRFRLFDRTEAWIFFRELLPELRPVHYWNITEPTDCIDGFLRFISRAKDEMVGPEEFAAYAQRVEDPQERAQAQEIQRVYRIYQERMRTQGALDFGDLIVLTVQALRERPALLSEIRSRYRYLLVDEFQDTNVAQIALLGLLAGDRGNLCVVGDDDQAIYRFRGASFSSFLLVKSMYPSVQTLRLTRNYRSTPPILAGADRLIRHNEPDRYDPEKRLWTDRQEGAPVEAIVCRDEQDEAWKAVRTIRSLAEAEPSGAARLDQIAVLYRAHHHRDRLVDALREAGIPFFVHGGIALFDQPEIKDLIAFLKVLLDPSDSIHLFRLLSHPIWGISPEDLMTLSRLARDRQISLWEALRLAQALEVAVSAKEGIDQFFKEVTRWTPQAVRLGVDRLIPAAAQGTSLRLLFHSREALQLLGRFLRFVYRYAETHPGSEGLDEFLRYSDSYRQAGGDPRDEEEETLGNQVRLMTIHQAKGLEFDWVILLGMVQGRFPTRARPEAIPFPVELMKESLPKGDSHLQEERRLCYVAATRARRGLFLMTQERAYHRPSVFAREISEGADSDGFLWRQDPEPEEPVPVGLRGAGPAAAAEGGRTTGLGPAEAERKVLEILQEIRQMDVQDEDGFSSALRRMSEAACLLHREKEVRGIQSVSREVPLPARFSYTQLETYRYCPMKYQYSYLYQIPIRPTPQMNFGIDLHGCLEGFFRKVMEGQVPPLEDLRESFRRLHGLGRYGEPYQDQEYRRLGLDLLTSFYRKNEGKFPVPLFVERTFSLPLGQAGIRGVIDRVDPLPEGGVEVIDYKTGKPKEKADFEDQLQLWLYALACKETLKLEPKRVSFYYLRTGEKLSVDYRPGVLEQVKEQVLEIIADIRSGNFAPDPSPRKCRWCDFKNLCPASQA